ncbi:MAG: hypothetical protein JJ866_02235 [Roseibium sp.]|uniref:hypothetical protein n=1 Tax=Roseibium sp. TaxID=1936156 RepID=UPI001B1C878F|nr:hypothetical protein [Roseibium sp.]MBO6890736.1 hypothetical protein [Roseibium sp.]MBO6930995.1 hypothetical protein [Roseibium sp.]
MRRISSTAFLAALIMSGAVMAKPVQTETIPINPEIEPQSAPIPTEDLELPESAPVESGTGSVESEPDPESAELPQVLYSTDLLPKPVKRMHDQLREAALSGNLERIRMVLESNELPPTLSFGDIDDPIDFLKASSGDGEGFEIMAILADTLDAGYLHVDVGTPQEMYIWPYFARYPLYDLTPDQKVEMFRIVTAGDFADMEDFGAWTFYRVGIGPDGTLHYFVAGD